jgi:elongation factor Tu
MSTSVRDIKARITLLTSAEGGRTSPAKNGYRPQFYYDKEQWDAAIELIGKEEISPGESQVVFFQFATPKNHVNRLRSGKQFELKEGPKTVAVGEVLEIIDLAERGV